MNTSEFDDVMVEFITESRENLDELDTALVTLEQHPDPGVIAKIFRAVHTIKGTSGFLGLRTLESVTHIGENLLSKMRDGEMPVTEANTTGLLGMADAVRAILDNVEATGSEGSETYPALIEQLSRLNSGEAPAAVAPAPAPAPEAAPVAADATPAKAKSTRRKAAAEPVVEITDAPTPRRRTAKAKAHETPAAKASVTQLEAAPGEGQPAGQEGRRARRDHRGAGAHRRAARRARPRHRDPGRRSRAPPEEG